MLDQKKQDTYEAPTLLLKDSKENELFCYLEQIVNIEGKEYALLTPVDTPVTLFKINEKDEPELPYHLCQLNLKLKLETPLQQYFFQENYKLRLLVYLLNYPHCNNE